MFTLVFKSCNRSWALKQYHMGKNKKITLDKTGLEEKKRIVGPVSVANTGEIRIAIAAKPGAKISCVTGIEQDAVSVQIAARPVDGQANEELVKFIAAVLGLKKSDISLDKGSKSRQKLLVISSNSTTVASVFEKLTIAASKTK